MTRAKDYGKKQASIWFTEEERAVVDAKATAVGMNFSEYIRFVAVNAQIEVTVKEEGK